MAIKLRKRVSKKLRQSQSTQSAGTDGTGGTFRSTKTYDHNEGLSCVFRQWRAEGTHCKFLHGYPLKFKFTFSCTNLDERNWVQNFGGLKELKAWLHEMFDHTLIVAEDDPEIHLIKLLAQNNIAKLKIVPATGCEQIAKLAFDWMSAWLELDHSKTSPNSWRDPQRVFVESVEVSEHSNNSATYSIAQ